MSVLSPDEYDRLPRTLLGANMPCHAAVRLQDRMRRQEAEQGSAALRARILDYFAKGGRM